MGKKRKHSDYQNDLPPGVKHYERANDVPTDIRKYWYQREKFFSRWNEGIWLTDDAWFGVTPEPIAQTIAAHLAEVTPDDRPVIVDAFAGVGGNAIAFALSGHWKRVYAIEKDPATIACARHNAEIYGVHDMITFFEGDCFEVLTTKLQPLGEYSVLFASPPWGGPGYIEDDVFNLQTMQPYSLDDLWTAFSAFARDVVLYLPRSSDLKQLAEISAKHKSSGQSSPCQKDEVIHYATRGSSKALCYFKGNFNF